MATSPQLTPAQAIAAPMTVTVKNVCDANAEDAEPLPEYRGVWQVFCAYTGDELGQLFLEDEWADYANGQDKAEIWSESIYVLQITGWQPCLVALVRDDGQEERPPWILCRPGLDELLVDKHLAEIGQVLSAISEARREAERQQEAAYTKRQDAWLDKKKREADLYDAIWLAQLEASLPHNAPRLSPDALRDMVLDLGLSQMLDDPTATRA